MTGEELRAARKSLGLTAQGFADLVGVSNGRTVRYWESGDRKVPGPVAVLIKKIMDDKTMMQDLNSMDR